MRIISFNVNGIRAAHRKGVFDWLVSDSPDIFCVQETKAHPEQLAKAIIEVGDYRSYWAWSTARKGYSGVGVYTRHVPRDVRVGLGIERFDREGRTLMVDFGAFVLYNVYFPNGGGGPERLRFKLDFYDAFLEQVTDLRRRGKPLVMCGDYNTAHKEVDLARPEANRTVSGFLPEECAWLDTYVSSGFVDTFRMFTDDGGHYTWWDMKTRARARNVGWRLDYFFVNDALADEVKHSYILPDIEGSDHCPIGLELSITPT